MANNMTKQQVEDQERNKNMYNNYNGNNCLSEFDEMGFADMLGVHDLDYSMFDLLQFQQQYNDPVSYLGSSGGAVLDQSSLVSLHQQPPDPSPAASSVLLHGESSEVVNTPTTPNSISISSSSSDAAVDDHHHHAPPPPVGKGDDVEEKNAQHADDNSDDKQLKPKTKKQKRQKQPRFAFMTKSEVDHLDDGYRWRKYGQKAVKNSPFPRSYYRCTTPACGVKKRVERSSSDQTIVVTTYEGQHTHPCPVMTRGGININLGMGTGTEMMISNPSLDQCSTTSTTKKPVFSRDSAPSSSLLHHQYLFQNQYLRFQNHQSFTSYLLNPMTPSSMSFTSGGNTTTTAAATTISTNSMIHNLNMQRHSMRQLKDDGLLQDMVPTQMQNESTKEKN